MSDSGRQGTGCPGCGQLWHPTSHPPQVSPTRHPRLPSAGMWASHPPSPASLSGSQTTRGKCLLDTDIRPLCGVTAMPQHWPALPPSHRGTGSGTVWRCKRRPPSTGMTSAARPETGTSASLVSEQPGALPHLSGGVKPQWCWPPALLALCPAASPAQTSRSFLVQEALTVCIPSQPRSTSPCGSRTPETAALATGQRWLLC